MLTNSYVKYLTMAIIFVLAAKAESHYGHTRWRTQNHHLEMRQYGIIACSNSPDYDIYELFNRAVARGQGLQGDGQCTFPTAEDIVSRNLKKHTSGSGNVVWDIVAEVVARGISSSTGIKQNLCWEDLCNTEESKTEQVPIFVIGMDERGEINDISLVGFRTITTIIPQQSGGCYIHMFPDPFHIQGCSPPQQCDGWLGRAKI